MTTPHETLWVETQRLPLVACPNSVPNDIDGFEQVCINGMLSLSGQMHMPDETCGGTGKVRSDVYRTVEMAITVSCDACKGRGETVAEGDGAQVEAASLNPDLDPARGPKQRDRGYRVGDDWHWYCFVCNGTGRIVRPQPGVMACPESYETASRQPVAFLLSGLGGVAPAHTEVVPCVRCGAAPWHNKELRIDLIQHNYVPDPSEAGVRARLEACGLFNPVRKSLTKVPGYVTGQRLLDAEKAYYALVDALEDDDYDGTLDATLETVGALAVQEAR